MQLPSDIDGTKSIVLCEEDISPVLEEYSSELTLAEEPPYDQVHVPVCSCFDKAPTFQVNICMWTAEARWQ
jgi:hypothetical protein